MSSSEIAPASGYQEWAAAETEGFSVVLGGSRCTDHLAEGAVTAPTASAARFHGLLLVVEVAQQALQLAKAVGVECV